MKEQKTKEKNLKIAFKTVICYVLFLVLSVSISLQVLDIKSHKYQYNLRNLFGDGDKSKEFSTVERKEDIWNWLVKLPNVIKCQNEDRFCGNNLIKDYSSHLFGYLIVKQKRIKQEKCSNKFKSLETDWKDVNNFYSNKIFFSNNNSCFDDYSIFNEDKHNYTLNWKNIINQTDDNLTINDAFKYSDSNVLKDGIYFGKYGSYLGGGYVYKMINNDSQSIKNDLLFLQKMSWIDKRTRALFIEFNLFNPNVNLFSYCQMVFELLPSGNIISSSKFITISLWSNYREIAFTCCLTCYLIVILIMLTKQIKQFKSSDGFNYFFQFWIYIDWCLFGCSFASLSIYLYKLYSMHSLMKEVKEKKTLEIYLSFNNLSQWNETLGIILSFCSFLITIKLINLLKFDKKLFYLSNAIKKCSNSLISFLIVFIILWLSYVQLMYLLFNGTSLGYSTFIKSMETSLQILIGKFNLKQLIEKSYFISAIIFSSYNIIMLLIMVNILITIISDKFIEARKEAKSIKETSILEYLIQKIKQKIFQKENYKMKNYKRNNVNYLESCKMFEIRTNRLINDIQLKIQNDIEMDCAITDLLREY